MGLELAQVVMDLEDMALVELDLALLVMGLGELELVALDQVEQEDMELVAKQESLQSRAMVHLWVELGWDQVTDF